VLWGPRFLSLSLWNTKNPVVLAAGPVFISSWRQSGWDPLPPMEALREFDCAPRFDSVQLRHFVASNGLASRRLPTFRDREVVAFVRASIRRGDVLVLQQGSSAAAPSNDTLELRRLLAQIEKRFRDGLTFQGRRYKLALGENLANVPGRNSYEVVAQAEARAVLEGIAKESPAGSDPLAKAREKIGKDWRPPFSQPEGLVLLRRIPLPTSAPKEDVPAITPSQMKALMDKATLEIHVVDLTGVPQEGLAYSIDMPDGGSAQGKLDKDGCATARSSQPGIFTVSFPDLDGADWDGVGALELPPEEERSEASKYEVKQGDRLPTIARATGFARWQTIWDFAGNTTLRELRSNPCVLLKGDQVAIPSKQARVAEVEGGTAEYVVQTAPETLRVRFAEAQAAEDEPVMFRAIPDAGSEMFEGQLADDGTMKIDLPPDTSKVTVELYSGEADDPFVTYEFDVGHLDPCSEATGIQMRLANLGYYDGEIDGDVGIVTRSAIRRFRSEYGLPLGDDIDEDLRNALAWIHDDDDDTDECDADQTTPADAAAGGGDEHGEADNDDRAEDEDTDVVTTSGTDEQPPEEPGGEEPEEWPPEAWGRALLEQEGSRGNGVDIVSEDNDGTSREESG
jgi:hypothetical protein